MSSHVPTEPMMPSTIPAVARPVFPPAFMALLRPQPDKIQPTSPTSPYPEKKSDASEITNPAMLRPLVVPAAVFFVCMAAVIRRFSSGVNGCPQLGQVSCSP